jgi:hypothetical protein
MLDRVFDVARAGLLLFVVANRLCEFSEEHQPMKKTTGNRHVTTFVRKSYERHHRTISFEHAWRR